MDLPLLSALFIGFALTLYVMLDGFDLGVGALLLLASDEEVRDRMIDSIMPTWDGNETWLVMAGVTLLAGFPIAYGILLPAFYLPLIIMLLSLGLRGVSFEFRWQTARGRRTWDVAFSIGSIVAALMQGLIVGGLIQGIAVQGEAFGGSVRDVFMPFCILTAASVLSAYVVLGAGWLHLKGRSVVRSFAERSLRRATPAFVALAAASVIAAVVIQSHVANVWAIHTGLLSVIVVLFVGVAGTLVATVGRRPDCGPFALALALMALGIAGLGLGIFPMIVPFKMSLWDAASSSQSQLFELIGVAIVAPIVLGYSAFAYYVFRGKTPERGWES
jgi:cytochrome d ubiquinol oxidase subunit II